MRITLGPSWALRIRNVLVHLVYEVDKNLHIFKNEGVILLLHDGVKICMFAFVAVGCRSKCK